MPAPPSHAVNRGILIEGLCSFLSGIVGCGHATTTSGGNIGAIGITKVKVCAFCFCCEDLIGEKGLFYRRTLSSIVLQFFAHLRLYVRLVSELIV